MAYNKKKYGNYRTEYCPFCGKTALSKNEQGVAVCKVHTKTNLQDMKCMCGQWLEIKKGKWGAYAMCESCGSMNLKKAFEINDGPEPAKVTGEDSKTKSRPSPKSKPKPREITVRSDELDFL